MISVDLERFPQHREAIAKVARRWLHDGQTAVLDRADWQAIRAGAEPPLRSPPMGDARPDPIRDQSCCDPPLE